ncbi:MAG: hypothetical protein HUU49_03090 [Candidatus Buchananbacteria bacterium]|nr:hypothetical protein [Candidatus Buchananbacteria bacterium]
MKQQPTFQDLIAGHVRPGAVSIIGITGQAGAGKSNHIAPLAKAQIESVGYPAEILGLDVFFKLSSRARKAWLNEDGVDPEELTRRADQMTWWDFDRAQSALNDLLAHKPLHLEGVYNRADGGELTGEVHIVPPKEGMAILFDGVAICHLQGMCEIAYVHTPASVRLERLRARDRHRQGAEVLERFRLTQAFEVPYFHSHWHHLSCWLDNSRQDPLVLSSLDQTFALSEDGLPGQIIAFDEKAG